MSYGIYAVGIDGTGYRQIKKFDAKVQDITHLSFSPDGSAVAVSILQEKHLKIFLLKLDGSSFTELTNEDSLDSCVPTFTPDGKKILFTCLERDGGVSLYMMNADGSNKELFKKNAMEGELAADGSRVVFMRHVDGVFGNK